MENRLKRCNIRFVGLPEGAEGTDPQAFLENLLITTFLTSFVMDRAHRLGCQTPFLVPPPPSPCTFKAKFMNFRERDAILRLSREKGNIPFHNWKVAAPAPAFTEVKRQLRFKNLKYVIRVPGWPHLTHDTCQTTMFTKPASPIPFTPSLL